MRLTQTLKTQRAALIAGVGVLVLLGLLVIMPIVFLFAAQHEDLRETAQEIAEYRSRLSRLPALTEEAAGIRERASNISGLLVAEDSATASGNLQRAIEELIAHNGGEIRSTELANPETVEGFEKITIDNDFALPVNALADLLYALESHEPYLFVSEMEITTPRDWERAIENREEPRLQIEWSVYAFRWGAAS